MGVGSATDGGVVVDNSVPATGGDVGGTGTPTTPAVDTPPAGSDASGLNDLAYTSTDQTLATIDTPAPETTSSSSQTSTQNAADAAPSTRDQILNSLSDLADRAKTDPAALKQFTQVVQSQANAADAYATQLQQDNNPEKPNSQNESDKTDKSYNKEVFQQAGQLKDAAGKQKLLSQQVAQQKDPTGIDNLLKGSTDLRQQTQKLVQQQSNANAQQQGDKARQASKGLGALENGGKNLGEEGKPADPNAPTHLIRGQGLVSTNPTAGAKLSAPTLNGKEVPAKTPGEGGDAGKKLLAKGDKKTGADTKVATKDGDKEAGEGEPTGKKDKLTKAEEKAAKVAKPTDKQVEVAKGLMTAMVSPAKREENTKAAAEVRNKIETAKLAQAKKVGDQPEAKPGEALVKGAHTLAVESDYEASHRRGLNDIENGAKTLAGYVSISGKNSDSKAYATLSAKYGDKQFDQNQADLASVIQNPRGQFASSLEGPAVLGYWNRWKKPEAGEDRTSLYLAKQVGQGGSAV